MNTANILEPHTIAAQAPTTRAAELYPLVLTPRILNSRGIGARHIRAMVAAGTLQRIQRGAYIYTPRCPGAHPPMSGSRYGAWPPTSWVFKGFSHTHQQLHSGG